MAFEITKNVKKSIEQTLQEVNSGLESDNHEEHTVAFEELAKELDIKLTPPAEDRDLTALRAYILDNGFTVSAVAFHIVVLCSQPMVTPSTTDWDFADRQHIPELVYALLNKCGYLEGIWPSLKIVMGSNKANSAWTAGIATTIAFFDTIRVLPTLKELKK